MRAIGFAVGDRVERFQRRRNLAGRGNSDGELAVGHVGQRLGESLRGAEQEVEARLKGGRHSPSHFRVRIGDRGTCDAEPRGRPEPHHESSSRNPHVRPPIEANKGSRRSVADRSRGSFFRSISRSTAAPHGRSSVRVRRDEIPPSIRRNAAVILADAGREDKRRPTPPDPLNRDASSPCGRGSRGPVRPGHPAGEGPGDRVPERRVDRAVGAGLQGAVALADPLHPSDQDRQKPRDRSQHERRRGRMRDRRAEMIDTADDRHFPLRPLNPDETKRPRARSLGAASVGGQ